MRAALFAAGLVVAVVARSASAQASPPTCIGNPDPHSLVGGAICVAGEAGDEGHAVVGAVQDFVQHCVREQTLPPHPCSTEIPLGG